jgi:hypothetical protein
LDKLGAFDSGLFDSQSSVRHIEIWIDLDIRT